MCEQLAQGRYPAVHRAGVEPATSQSVVRQAAATPPTHTSCSNTLYCKYLVNLIAHMMFILVLLMQMH